MIVVINMLSEDTLERLSERLVDRIESLNTYFIKKIGKQIKTIGTITPSQLSELMQSVQYGADIEELMNKIAEITDMNAKDIYDIFEEVAKKNQSFSKKFYEYKKVKFIPYEENKILQDQVMNIANATANEYINMSKTFAYMTTNSAGIKEYTSLSDIYQKITDEAVLSIAQGRESYQMAMKKAMKELTSKGMRTVDYASGYSRRADSSVRLNMMDGIRRLNRELQESFGKEFGANGIEVSHHLYAAPDHIDTIDGRQFSTNGEVVVNGIKYQDYDTVNDSLKRHVGELNCYHFPFQIVLGVSKPLYSKEQLETDKQANMKGFEFEGSHYTMYEGTQLQRQIETKIRQYKDRQIGARAIDDTDEVYHCQEKIRQLTDKYKELSDVSGLPTKVDRLRVDGYRSINVKRDIIENENISSVSNNYIDITQEWLDNATPNSHKVLDRNYFEYEGVKYQVDGRNVVLDYSSKEKEVAKWLENTFGGELYMLPRVCNPDGISTADYLWNSEKWDLKTINGIGKRVIEDAVKKKKKQANNFIFDITPSKIEKENLYKQLQKLYNSKTTNWINKVIVKNENDVIVIYKRK